MDKKTLGVIAGVLIALAILFFILKNIGFVLSGGIGVLAGWFLHKKFGNTLPQEILDFIGQYSWNDLIGLIKQDKTKKSAPVQIKSTVRPAAKKRGRKPKK